MRPLVRAPLVLTLLVARPIAAQRQPPAQFPRYHADFPAAAAQHADTTARPAEDYRWTGVAVGAVSFGALGAWLSAGFCGMDDDVGKRCLGAAVLGLAGGATIGAALGGFIGSAVGKPTPPPTDSLHLHAMPPPNHHGMGIGAALVGGTFASIAWLSCTDGQGEHSACTGPVLKYGALGVLAGGLVGALIDGASTRRDDAPP
jgi:hypothetical protein